jgi:hypothetical protein
MMPPPQYGNQGMKKFAESILGVQTAHHQQRDLAVATMTNNDSIRTIGAFDLRN